MPVTGRFGAHAAEGRFHGPCLRRGHRDRPPLPGATSVRRPLPGGCHREGLPPDGARDLLLRGGGSCHFRVPVKDSAYGYRYAGLRLFHRAGGKVSVVPREWSPQHGTLYQLEQSESVRIEYVRGGNKQTDECSSG